VKAIVGSGTTITYGADWTEYGAHVVDAAASEVRFPLDALWSSAAIDAIGIDYYAPLSDWRNTADQRDSALTDNPYGLSYLAGNLARGEGYDWYYADDAARDSQTRSSIIDGLGKPWMFRQKDLWNFWSQRHYERIAGTELINPTAWVPRSKPIWLTEVGCPAVDKGANQPSVFPDPKSSEAGLPHYSNGKRDDLIQCRYLEAVLSTFDPAFGDASLNPGSPVYVGRMIAPDGIHVWTWDARPYPVFPAATDAWSDAANWQTGHWLTGRLGSTPLDGLVSKLLADNAVTDTECSELGEGPDGYVIDRPMAARAMLDPLALAFAFDAFEQNGTLRFRQRGGAPVVELTEDDLVLPDESAPVRLTRGQERDLPHEVTLGFTDIGANYQRGVAASRRLAGGSRRSAHADLAIITNDAAAERRAEIWLQDLWAGRESADFVLPLSRLALGLGDIVALSVNDRRRLVELQEITDTESRAIRACSIDPAIFSLPFSQPRRHAPSVPAAIAPVHALVLDLPTLNTETRPVLSRLAVFADPWPGPVAVWASSDGLNFRRVGLALAPTIVGETLDDLPAGPTARWQLSNFRVRLYGGALASVSDGALLAGANAAAMRRADGAWEVIQFSNAELSAERTYSLSRLLRGQAGTEHAMGAPLPAGAPFVLLDQHLVTVASGLDALERTLELRVVMADRDHGDPATLALATTPSGTALKPLAPVHFKAMRSGSGVTFSWIRRTRIEGDTWVGEVPLGEDSEQYALDIISGAAVVRTLTSATPSVLYPSAAELSDFGAAQASLHVRVAQISATVGRGFSSEATLNP
jgi:GTA TIM-barrel-like domain/Putative phage tail protein